MKPLMVCATLGLTLVLAHCGKTPAPKVSGALDVTTLGKVASVESLFTPVDTLQLETVHASLIGQVDQIVKHPNGYLILDGHRGRTVFFFDNAGRFIRTLSRNGQGPGEYQEPNSVQCDAQGQIYVLDTRNRKMLIYDAQGLYQDYCGFAHLGIYPLLFEIVETDAGKRFVFYNLNSTFGRSVENKKFVVTAMEGQAFRILNYFGDQEPAGVKLMFSSDGFHIFDATTLFSIDIFDLGVEIFSLDGVLQSRITEHADLLPKPHITQETMLAFNRPSESLDTYYTLTRPGRSIFLNDLVLQLYLSNKRNNSWILFDKTGRHCPRRIAAQPASFLGRCRGTVSNRLLTKFQPGEDDGSPMLNSVLNPQIITYELEPRSLYLNDKNSQ